MTTLKHSLLFCFLIIIWFFAKILSWNLYVFIILFYPNMKRFKKSNLCLYLLIFIVILILFTVTFDSLSFIYSPIVLYPISYGGFLVLKVIGIPVIFDGPFGEPGFFEYQLPYTVLQITFGCAGIFALFILLAGIIAFPCLLKLKCIGIILSIPCFYMYSIFRLVFIGIIGYLFPSLLNFVHSYFMEIINIVFIMFVYIIWIRYVEKTSKTV